MRPLAAAGWVEGLEKSGLTFFYLDEGADSGDILLQKEFSIGQDDTAATLYEKIKLIATECLPEVLDLLATLISLICAR